MLLAALPCMATFDFLLAVYIGSLIAGSIILIWIQKRMFGERRLAWLPGLSLVGGVVVLYLYIAATGDPPAWQGVDLPSLVFSDLGYIAGNFLLLVWGVACLVAAWRRHKQPQPPGW